MSIADETLDNIKRENRLNPDDRIAFLLNELDYRERQIKELAKEISKQTVMFPVSLTHILDEYGIDYNGKGY